MPLELSFHKPALPTLPEAWRLPLLRLALAWVGLIALLWGEWADMVHQWWNASTYNHILLIPPILVWLVHLRRDELARLAPQAWWPGFGWLAPGLLAWLAGTVTDVNLVRQVGAVMVLQAAVPALLGPRITFGLLFPLTYMFFLVPFGDEIVPTLQAITAQLAIALTHASGVPAQIDGFFIDTPAGLFEVAEACSGVKFLVAMVALGTLVAHLCFSSPRRRAAFLAAAVIVPILANGVRAWGTIFVAQSQGLEFAAGFDHIVYGWIFFALVVAVLLGASWRFFDRSPDDPLVDIDVLRSSPLLTRLEEFAIGGWRALTVLLVLTAGTVAWMDRIAGVP
jgi:exosortase A